MFGGPEIITWLLLALGGALAVGNLAALMRPDEAPRPSRPQAAKSDGGEDGDEQPARAQVGRSVVMIAVGTVIAVWAIASLIGG